MLISKSLTFKLIFMKTVKNFLISALLLSLIFFNACKKDTTTTNSNPANYLAPSLVKDTLINLPAAISTKEQAYDALPYPADTLGLIVLSALITDADIVNVWTTSLSSAFWITPADLSYFPGYKATKNSDGSTTYSYNLSAYGITEGVALTYYNSSGDSWWKYSIDSASYSKVYYYVDDKGTSGTIDWYNTESIKSASVLALSDEWSISNGTTNSTFSFYNNDGTLNEKYVSTSTTSKSGTLLVTGQNNNTGPLVNQWSFTWTGAGTGSYIEYGTDGVSIISQGNF